MNVEIMTGEARAIDWGASGAAAVAQNVYTLINTRKYEVAYDRTLGMSEEYVDLPLPEAIPLAIAQIYAVVDEREPRAFVKDVAFVGATPDGAMNFKVVVEL